MTHGTSLRKRHLSYYCSFKHNICFCLCPRNSLLPILPFIQACPSSLPLRPANLVHMVSDSSSLARKQTGAADSKREQGKSLAAHKLPFPPPPSCSLQISFCEGVPVCFPWSGCFFINSAVGVGGCNSLLLHIIDLSSW